MDLEQISYHLIYVLCEFLSVIIDSSEVVNSSWIFGFYYIFLSNKLDDRYLSPLSHTIVTMTPYSKVLASLIAAAIAPPLLTPAKMASYLASLRHISSAYC